MADSTLAAIRTKIRKLTRSPSENQITDATIDEYVNTYLQYDFPEQLRLFIFHKNFTFFTEPNIDTYTLESLGALQEYITFNPPVYIAGYLSGWSQSQQEFYNIYPFTNTELSAGTGDGATLNFNGTLSATPILQNQVTFTATSANNDGLYMSDDGDGILSGPDGIGTINYTTGAYTLTWTTPPDGDITAQVNVYAAARPRRILYFEKSFVVRPVPDKVYKVQLEAFVRPTELLAAGTSPELEQWWQLFAYGAAKKIFEDRGNSEGVEMILPEFNKQERLVLRRTLQTQKNERAATIYSEQTGLYGNRNNWPNW